MPTIPTAAEFRAAGLYDPDAPDAADRLALLEWVAAQGISLEQMAVNRNDRSLITLPGDLAIRPGLRVTLAEAAKRAGIAPELLQRARVASGLMPAAPDVPEFTEADIVGFQSFAATAAFFGTSALLQFSRVLGASVARIAEAAIALFIANVELPGRELHASSVALAQANLNASQAIGVIPQTIECFLRAHVEAAVRRQRIVRGEERGDLVGVTVGFVDLVGFTPLARRLSVTELGALVERFEGLANDVVASRTGRLVKHVGDAVMFVAPRADAACDIALTLMEQFADDDIVRPRGGLAAGDVLMRNGDYYGPVVNLASRVGDLAVPREILVTPAVVDGARGAPFAFEPAGKRMLKGVDEPQPVFVASRAPAEP
ncbi:MAG TPA: adenylate/guanylate cyclase domain-containing protein [Candidatus Binatia bacterium]|jgi:class 3 adenylate cyclase